MAFLASPIFLSFLLHPFCDLFAFRTRSNGTTCSPYLEVIEPSYFYMACYLNFPHPSSSVLGCKPSKLRLFDRDAIFPLRLLRVPPGLHPSPLANQAPLHLRWLFSPPAREIEIVPVIQRDITPDLLRPPPTSFYFIPYC